jgi:DnaJ-class molecular chaperone
VDVNRAYATLGVSDTATWADLRRAYRAHLQAYHPDTGPGNVRALQSVTAAYRKLRSAHVSPEPESRWPEEQPPAGRLVDLYA